MQNFSVLMSVYIKEKPKYLDQCLKSLMNQTYQPTEIIIVQDGPITKELHETIQNWKKKLNIVDVIIPENQGLGNALNIGLNECKYELVARMDTDDICRRERFEKQLTEFKKHQTDVVGSWIDEFVDNPNTITGTRRVPIEHKKILTLSKFKNPLNHPSVMYKKSKIIKLGSYEDMPYFEDYYLWLKLLNNHVIIRNIPESLVIMRAGPSQLSRRSGLSYAKKELQFIRNSYKNGYIGKKALLFSVLIRIPTRLVPKTLISILYKASRAHKKSRTTEI